ncbi:MAG: hypothetical protein IPL65_01635 [Lewinellaceae bacterium]|nr:hypothetical protein [Lewinellaceae bacterium]
MSITEQETHNFQQKVARYQQILENTKRYRETWHSSLKNELLGFLEQVTSIAKLSCVVEARADIENLEAVVVSLGSAASGLGEPVGDGLHRELIKKNGALVYQQLFNGKILVLINYPYIEKYGEPQPPKTVAIYRPEELKAPLPNATPGILYH